MNLNLQCPKILQIIKMDSKNYQDSCDTGCRIPEGCRIMIVEEPNLIMEARSCGELVGKICNFFYPHVPFSPLSWFMSN